MLGLTAVEVPVSSAWMLHLGPPPDRPGKIADVTVSGLDSPTAGDGKCVCLLGVVGSSCWASLCVGLGGVKGGAIA